MKEYHLAPGYSFYWNRLNCLHPDHQPDPEKHGHLERMMPNHWMKKTHPIHLGVSYKCPACKMTGLWMVVEK